MKKLLKELALSAWAQKKIIQKLGPHNPQRQKALIAALAFILKYFLNCFWAYQLLRLFFYKVFPRQLALKYSLLRLIQWLF